MNLWPFLRALFVSSRRLPPATCADRVRAGTALLIDVREPLEWVKTGVAEHAILLPLSDLSGARKEWKPFLAEAKDRELLFYCAGGGRSALAARLLAKEGFRTANTGKLAHWAAIGWRIIKW